MNTLGPSTQVSWKSIAGSTGDFGFKIYGKNGLIHNRPPKFTAADESGVIDTDDVVQRIVIDNGGSHDGHIIKFEVTINGQIQLYDCTNCEHDTSTLEQLIHLDSASGGSDYTDYANCINQCEFVIKGYYRSRKFNPRFAVKIMFSHFLSIILYDSQKKTVLKLSLNYRISVRPKSFSVKFGSELSQIVSKCVKLCQSVSNCVKLWQTVSKCVKLFQGVPNCFFLTLRPDPET